VWVVTISPSAAICALFVVAGLSWLASEAWTYLRPDGLRAARRECAVLREENEELCYERDYLSYREEGYDRDEAAGLASMQQKFWAVVEHLDMDTGEVAG
jgi:hypothetical protein